MKKVARGPVRRSIKNKEDSGVLLQKQTRPLQGNLAQLCGVFSFQIDYLGRLSNPSRNYFLLTEHSTTPSIFSKPETV